MLWPARALMTFVTDWVIDCECEIWPEMERPVWSRKGKQGNGETEEPSYHEGHALN